jgi:predicted amidophosphoribosyltransferase
MSQSAFRFRLGAELRAKGRWIVLIADALTASATAEAAARALLKAGAASVDALVFARVVTGA